MFPTSATRQLVGQNFSQINRLLVRYLRRMTRCPDRAQDLAQLAWLKVLAADQRGVHTPTDSTLRAYLFTVARHTFIDECTRKHEAIRTQSFDPALLDLIHTAGDAASDPADELQHAQVSALIERSLQGLPPTQREVVLLWLAETSIKSMANMVGAPPDTVLSRKKYAFARLRVELDGFVNA